jgi:replication factor C subunit 2/4
VYLFGWRSRSHLYLFIYFQFLQEANSRITRFILICNYVTRIIEPLASRCAKFRFQSLPPLSMKQRLTHIAQSEGCQIEESHLDSILSLAEGDMRRAVTTLQSVHALGEEVVNETAIAELAGLPPDSVVDELYQVLSSSSSSSNNTTTTFDVMKEAVQEVCAAGYSAQSISAGLLQRFVVSPDLNELGRAKLAIRIAEAEHRMIDGADEYLQLLTVCGLALDCFRDARAANTK